MENRNWSVIAYADGWTLWMYKDQTISITEMQKPDFFKRVKDLMEIGDVMYLVAKDTVKHMWVKTLTPVTLEDMGK